MEWNLTTEVQNSLESLARDEALLSQEGHIYLPKTLDDAARFNPHEWVLEAMRRAYVMGRIDGAKGEAQVCPQDAEREQTIDGRCLMQKHFWSTRAYGTRECLWCGQRRAY